MGDEPTSDGKKRQKLTLVALVVSILIGVATLFGIVRGVVIYPSNLEASIRDVHKEAQAADAKAVAVAADLKTDHAQQIVVNAAQEVRLKGLEDYRAELKGVLDLLVYRANETKIALDKMNDKLDRRERDKRITTPGAHDNDN